MNITRSFTNQEGRWINLQDLQRALQDDEHLRELVFLQKVGASKNRPPEECMRAAVGSFIATCIGDFPRLKLPPT